MSDYMRKLRETTGYTSLKEQYNAMIAKLFNKMENSYTAPDDMDKYVRDEWDGHDVDELTKGEESSEDKQENDLAEK